MTGANEFLGIDPIDAAIAAIDEQIEKLLSARTTLEGIRGMTGNASSAATGSRVANADLKFSHDAFFGMTAGDAARKYLAARKKTASATVIGEALVAGGWKTASKNVSENIRAILSRNDEFVKINGEFGLSEWYPGRKSGPKPRLVAQPATITQTAEQADEGVSEEKPTVSDVW